jgi:membrane protease subunit HflK
MQRVLTASNKVIVDSKGASTPIILPPDVFRPRAPVGAPAPAAAAAPPRVEAPPSQAQAQGRTGP